MRALIIIFVGFLVCTSVHADEVVNELSRRSAISVPELNEILSDCERYQLNMNICAFRDFVQVDLELNKVISKKLQSLPADCKVKLKNSQAKWENRMDRNCSKEADEEAGEGSMRPMIYSGCKTTATESRIEYLKKIERCIDVK